jgi:hypothetical protein
MKRILILVFLYLAALSVSVSAEAQTMHLIKLGSWVQRPVTPETLNRRIEQEAAQYISYVSLPRAVFHDIAYPADAKEYAALHGFGVMLVSVFSQDKEESVFLHGWEIRRLRSICLLPSLSKTVEATW